ncbi:MAG: hypothetical protein FWD71_17600, partial [Oscillospiraceae bacterium]|nr:hypothetical protein [Oscillospiraceae bacterium]
MSKNKVKFTIIGAGSISFAPLTIADILTNKNFSEVDVEIALMDIDEEALRLSESYCRGCAEVLGKKAVITATLDLRKSLENADFVITCFEKDRYYYWSQDFHIPRRYGFRQIYGENGGPGGMFHALRNMKPMMVIVKAMEEICPNALLLNYTNPEAKLVEATSKLSKINSIGLCHGEMGGVGQLSMFLQIPVDDLDTEACGLNHFGWFTKVVRKSTGEDLYPLLREKEKSIDLLAQWDQYGLSRIMFRTYGLWPYPGANHIGEYIAWSDEFLASAKIQYFYDPAEHNPWKSGRIPEFVYSFSQNPTDRELFPKGERKYSGDPDYTAKFEVNKDSILHHHTYDYGIRISEAVFFDKPTYICSLNVPNRGYIPNVLEGMAVELPAIVDGKGIHPKKMPPLPTAVAAMISQQGAIHDLLIQAFNEKSKNKLL